MRRQTNTINWSADLPLAQGIKFGSPFHTARGIVSTGKRERRMSEQLIGNPG